eukprot:194170-Pelagomonas_calceolata.AAC.1
MEDQTVSADTGSGSHQGKSCLTLTIGPIEAGRKGLGLTAAVQNSWSLLGYVYVFGRVAVENGVHGLPVE